MDPFEQIWESSRTNSLSWMYSTVLYSGVAVIVALSFIKNQWLRLIGTLAVIAVFPALATGFASQEIQEKWRIRRDWADSHPGQMTQDGLEALTVDGANLTLGPLIYGVQAFLLFAAVAVALMIFRALLSKRHRATITLDSDEKVDLTAIVTSDNPYHPPSVTP